MTPRLAPLLCALAVASTARAGGVEAAASVDVFHADNAGAGSPEVAGAQELGIGARLRFREFDDDLRFAAHYTGREPLFGDVQNTALRTLWETWLSYALLDDAITLRAGRFAVPAATLLVVDGADARFGLPWGFTASLFGGRRGLTSSLREAGVSLWLPVVGAGAGWRHDLASIDVVVDYAQDQAYFANGATESPWGGFDALAQASSRPFDWLMFGGRFAFVQRGAYALGPTWTDLRVQTQVIDLFSAYGFAEWRPHHLVRLGYDVQYQRPRVVRTASLVGPDEVPELVDPFFLDNRVTASVSPFAIGWLRAGARHRWRPERNELRYFGEIDVNHLAPVGVYGKALVVYEDVIENGAAWDPGPDRLLGSTAVGYEDYGFDVSTGISYIERSATPWSGRSLDATRPADLSPFVLEAQRIWFVRGSYGMREWYVAVDAERNVDDAEYRFFVQVGGRLELAW